MELRTRVRGYGLDSSDSLYGAVAGSYETSDTIKREEFIKVLSYCKLLRKDFAPWN
jgi:hypothetical protein